MRWGDHALVLLCLQSRDIVAAGASHLARGRHGPALRPGPQAHFGARRRKLYSAAVCSAAGAIRNWRKGEKAEVQSAKFVAPRGQQRSRTEQAALLAELWGRSLLGAQSTSTQRRGCCSMRPLSIGRCTSGPESPRCTTRCRVSATGRQGRTGCHTRDDRPAGGIAEQCISDLVEAPLTGRIIEGMNYALYAFIPKWDGVGRNPL